VQAEPQIGLDSFLDRRKPRLLEPCDFGLREVGVREVRKRRTSPEIEGLAERCGSPSGSPSANCARPRSTRWSNLSTSTASDTRSSEYPFLAVTIVRSPSDLRSCEM